VEPSIFVCTVHIGSEPFWSSVQPKFIRRNLPRASLLAAIDDGIRADADFDYMEVMEGEHKDKLDELGRRVVDSMANADDDILIFFDGDAFPVRALMPYIVDALQAVPLAAICREEMPDEDFPHPSFCVTTVGFWKEIGGTWQLSSDPAARRNDLGCRLRDLLRERGIEWRRLLRSNEFNPHPVLFGLYGGLIYHHGAGFRRPVTALDRGLWRKTAPEDTWTSPDRYRFFYDVIASQNQVMSGMFKRLIEHVPDFHRLLELPSHDGAWASPYGGERTAP
jgi:hypothetical protein